jgi:hypothetical protein
MLNPISQAKDVGVSQHAQRSATLAQIFIIFAWSSKAGTGSLIDRS